MLLKTPKEIIDLGRELAAQHHKVLLYGELGAGKTTFAKGFAEGLGINPMMVTSPTYTYQNVYDKKLLHIDMYRIESLEKLHETWLLEQISNHDAILIEWPRREELYTAADRWKVEITKEQDGSRNVTVRPLVE